MAIKAQLAAKGSQSRVTLLRFTSEVEWLLDSTLDALIRARTLPARMNPRASQGP